MSDGPHRSLKMPRGWKKLAERADNKAYAPEEVRDALPAALEEDWHAEVPKSLCRGVRRILGDSQISLFAEERSERLENLRRETAGHNFGNVLLDCAILAAQRGGSGDAALEEAASKALSDRAVRGARQVEEHYCRKSTEHRASHVRERIEAGVNHCDIAGLAGRLVGTGGTKGALWPAKQTGIEDGGPTVMGTAVNSIAELPVHRVDVVEPGQVTRPHRIGCTIGENLAFDTAGLEAYCFANWDVRVFDAFVVAAAVQFCDHTKGRSSVRWGREIELRIPVHDLALWRSVAISGTLRNALDFLTGDRWHLEFVARRKREVARGQINFNLPDSSRIVIPFSDGLDSLAVAELLEREHRNSLIRVRLGTRSLDRRLPKRRRIPFASVPYRVRYDKKRSNETSARSRGFKFALLSGIAAYLSDASRVIIPESGQGALGPALVPVGQTYEDYRNHPLFTNLMEAFLLALFGYEVRYEYPPTLAYQGRNTRCIHGILPRQPELEANTLVLARATASIGGRAVASMRDLCRLPAQTHECPGRRSYGR